MMKTIMERSEELRQKIEDARPYLQLDGEAKEGVRRVLEIVLDYVEFMVTPEDEETLWDE